MIYILLILSHLIFTKDDPFCHSHFIGGKSEAHGIGVIHPRSNASTDEIETLP